MVSLSNFSWIWAFFIAYFESVCQSRWCHFWYWFCASLSYAVLWWILRIWAIFCLQYARCCTFKIGYLGLVFFGSKLFVYCSNQGLPHTVVLAPESNTTADQISDKSVWRMLSGVFCNFISWTMYVISLELLLPGHYIWLVVFEWVFSLFEVWKISDFSSWQMMIQSDIADSWQMMSQPDWGLMVIYRVLLVYFSRGVNLLIFLWWHCFHIHYLLPIYIFLWGKLVQFSSLFLHLWLDFLIQMRIWIFIK